jgi:hypothetical protein
MPDYVVGLCVRCLEGLSTHARPEPVDRWTQDVEAGALG